MTSPERHRKQMLIRSHNDTCLVAMTNGLTLELTYNEGSTYGVWLFGERFLWWVVAGAA
jgi:hypothetical protein